MSEIVTIGLDIAKSVFQVHGVDEDGEVIVRRRLKRARVLPFECFASARFHRAGTWRLDASKNLSRDVASVPNIGNTTDW